MNIKIRGSKIDINNVWIAIAAITLLEVVALLKGLNGSLLRLVVATIAGLVGLAIPTPKVFKK